MDEKYLLPDWEDKNKLEKILTITSIILAVIVAIAIIITLATKHDLFFIYYTSIFLFLLTQAIQYWKYNKPISIIELICAIIFLLAEIITITNR